MPVSGRRRDLVTVILAVCSATIAVTGLTLGSVIDGQASAASRPEIAIPNLRTLPAVQPPRAQPAAASTALWLDPANPAAKASTGLLAQGRSSDAAALGKIASQPTATWLTNEAAATTAQRVISAASAVHQLPVLVTYYLPGRDCGGYSSGGAANPTQYRAWIAAIAGQLGSAPAIVIVEPDAVAMAASDACSAATGSGWRGLLSSSIATLKQDRNARVYLDAGNSGWVANQSVLATELRASGLAAADGFALNVSNFRTVTSSVSYASTLSTLVGGAHFVIDTSRNGAGPLPANSGYRGPSWCNPPGRALGPVPTLHTGRPLADGYLWIKYPGASDGSCGLGDPGAGVFWPEYAIGLASRS